MDANLYAALAAISALGPNGTVELQGPAAHSTYQRLPKTLRGPELTLKRGRGELPAPQWKALPCAPTDQPDDWQYQGTGPHLITHRTLRAQANAQALTPRLLALNERIIIGGHGLNDARSNRAALISSVRAVDPTASLPGPWEDPEPIHGQWPTPPSHWPMNQGGQRLHPACWARMPLHQAIEQLHPHDPHRAQWTQLLPTFEHAELSLRAPWISDAAIADFTRWAAPHLVSGALMHPNDINVTHGMLQIVGGGHKSRRAASLIARHLSMPDSQAEDQVLSQELDDLLASYAQAHPAILKQDFQNFAMASNLMKPANLPTFNWPGWQGPLPHDWQVDLAWQLSSLGEGIGVHEPGMGKTAAGVLTALRLLSGARKHQRILIVCPKSAYGPWKTELERQALRYVTAGFDDESGSDVPALQRQLQRAQDEHIHLILMSMTAFERLELDETQRPTNLPAPVHSALEQAQATGGSGVNLRSLNLKGLIVDEAHNYKAAILPQLRARHLSSNQEARRATDMLLKSWALREWGCAVMGLTATPWKNAPSDLYAMLAIFAPSSLAALRWPSPERWVLRYVDFHVTERGLEVRQLTHLHELRPALQATLHRRTAAQVGLKLPNYHPEVVFHQADPAMAAALRDLHPDHLQQLDGRAPRSEIEARLSMFMWMRRIELDLEFIDPVSWAGHVSPKVDAALAEIHTALQRNENVLVFCDLVDYHTPKGVNPNGYSVHQKLQRLIAERSGLPATAIAIANGKAATSVQSRRQIEEQLRTGQLRVVLGNTAVLGESMNVQANVGTMVSLDVPHNAAGMEQRRGRAVRQGNTRMFVRGYLHLGLGGVDEWMVDTLRAKANAAAGFWGDAQSAPMPEQELLPSLGALRAMSLPPAERQQALAALEQAEANSLLERQRRSLSRLWHRAQLSRHRDVHAWRRLSLSAERHNAMTPALWREFQREDASVLMPKTGQVLRVGSALISREGIHEVRSIDLATRRVTLRSGTQDRNHAVSALEQLEPATPKLQLELLVRSGHALSAELIQACGEDARGIFLGALLSSEDAWRPVLIRRNGRLTEVARHDLRRSDELLFGPEDAPHDVLRGSWLMAALRQGLLRPAKKSA